MSPTTESRVWAVLQRAFHQVAPEVELDQLDPHRDFLEQSDLDGEDLESVLEIVEDELGVPMTRPELEGLSTLEGIVESLSARAMSRI
jgi:hypothetical protein